MAQYSVILFFKSGCTCCVINFIGQIKQLISNRSRFVFGQTETGFGINNSYSSKGKIKIPSLQNGSLGEAS
jgi:hypothetical protein